MSPTWHSDAPPPVVPIGAVGWARAVLRGAFLAVSVFGGLALLLVLRVVEAPIHGAARPWTPWITQAVCRVAFVVLGMRYRVHGSPMNGFGAVVANHSSWLDIFALNARKRVYFVSKSEVASWPGIGWLACATGTVFITRDKRDAMAQQRLIEERLSAGHKLLFFPEGTSTDGQRVLPFKSTLFEAFFARGLPDGFAIQPVTVRYRAPPGEDPRFYGWWGAMGFGAHLVRVLAARRQGAVEVIYHSPIPVAQAGSRKTLARLCETAVRDGFELRGTEPETARPS